MAFAGIAMLVIGGVLLLADAGAVFVPIIPMVAGVAAMARASHERLKQRMDALEQRLAQAEWRGGINRTGYRLDRPLDPGSVYRNIVCKYGAETGISAEVIGLCVHSLRATAATNALSHDSDIAKVQEWLGHADISTTRLYDRRKSRPEDSPFLSCKVLGVGKSNEIGRALINQAGPDRRG